LSQMRSPDGVLASVLARRCGQINPLYLLPAIVGSAASINFIVGLVSPPGGRKSSTYGVAQELLDLSKLKGGRFDLSLGSGEGLAELYYEMVELEDGNKKSQERGLIEVRRRVVGMYVDEGEAITKLTQERSGSTSGSALRQAWSGSQLGNSNVGDNFRNVPKNTYRFAMVASFQFSNAAQMLGEGELGTAQRFLWTGTLHPGVQVDRPDWPGPLEIGPPAVVGMFGEQMYFKLPESVVTEIVVAEAAEVSGAVTVDLLDAHRRMMRLKVAALLHSLMEPNDPLNVTLLAWNLSEIVVSTSDRLRSQIEATALTVKADEENRRHSATVHRAVGSAVATADALAERERLEHERDVIETAKKLTAKVIEGKVTTRKDAVQKMMRHRKRLDEAIEYAEASNWLIVGEDQTGTGAISINLAAGPVRP
jgi:hypothetical protein